MPLNKVACLVLSNATPNYLFCYVLDNLGSQGEVPVSQAIDMIN
jgi:hypothetical protein